MLRYPEYSCSTSFWVNSFFLDVLCWFCNDSSVFVRWKPQTYCRKSMIANLKKQKMKKKKNNFFGANRPQNFFLFHLWVSDSVWYMTWEFDRNGLYSKSHTKCNMGPLIATYVPFERYWLEYSLYNFSKICKPLFTPKIAYDSSQCKNFDCSNSAPSCWIRDVPLCANTFSSVCYKKAESHLHFHGYAIIVRQF